MGAPLDQDSNNNMPSPSATRGSGGVHGSTQPGGGRGGFKKLFSRRKAGSNEESSLKTSTSENAPTAAAAPKSLSAQRNERASKKGKRWTARLSGGGKKDDPMDGSNNTTSHDGNRATSPQQAMILERNTSDQPMKPDPTPEELEAHRAVLMQKKMIKERDGFCRRVDFYDGQVITVDGQPSYELGSYLGGGVAGVVYEGHRLRPMEEYPVRLGAAEDTPVEEIPGLEQKHRPPSIVNVWGCMPSSAEDAVDDKVGDQVKNVPRGGSILTENSVATDGSGNVKRRTRTFKEDQALEMTASRDQMVMIDAPDAPSRSNHYAKAMSMHHDEDDTSITYGFMEETVAIKVLNPVGFRTLTPEALKDAVVARRGARLESEVVQGKQPMEERHVWWLVNPNSRNLRTLQRYSVPTDPSAPRRVEVDRGTAERGLRISLVAAFLDEQNQLKELPLTRCIEIWGHVPFGASDEEFRGLMKAIDAINAGHPPPPLPAFFVGGGVPGRIGTERTDSTGNTTENSSFHEGNRPKPMESKRTGIYRAATTARTTVYCDELKAYIALPAVPSKYIKWLRQRRAATKEIRNMMLIGRHRNVVHLFEVLELIQEKKSTMFLILELVRGGELFDLISSNAAKISKGDLVPVGYTESETVMRKFFRELASGVRYCHHNGIAHRDLKPENLLVHNGKEGKCTLKIADFGLSAVFGAHVSSSSDAAPGDDTTLGDTSYISSYMSAPPPAEEDINSPSSPPVENGESPLKNQVSKVLRAGGSALSYFTCGVVDEAMLGPCAPSNPDDVADPSPLKRMTSVVGSPHYVAPEIISQNEKKKNRSVGYDGTKADVWSAGVILYAMLFRSLPFGEDLLRCPRYQSFKKWYDEVKTIGRRASAVASLDPVITDQDQAELLGPQWFFPSKTSPESRDLIVAMLNPNPDLRPTINMVLRHPWLLRVGAPDQIKT